MTFRIAVSLALIAGAIGCTSVTDSAPHSVNVPAGARRALGVSLPRVDIFSRERFVRSTGAPTVFGRTVNASGYTKVVLHVANGDADGSHRVSSGRIAIGGVDVVGPAAFSQTMATIDVPLAIDGASSIRVQLDGTPGGAITLSIDAAPATSATIEPSGASIALLGAQLRLSAPAGAVSSPLDISAEPLSILPGPAIGGSGVDLEPTGTHFDAPVQLTMAYDPSALRHGIAPGALRIHWLDGSIWHPLPDKSVDALHQLVSGRTTHFTTFALLADSVRFCPSSPSDFQNLNDAVAAVADSGVVAVCPGTYAVSGVALTRGVAIVGESPRPVLDAGAATSLFTISNGTGAVRLTNLELRNGTNTLSITGSYGTVEVDHSVLVPTATGPLGFDAGVLVDHATGGGVSVHDDSMAVGDHGIIVAASTDVTIRDNATSPMSSTPIWIRPGGQAVVAHNLVRTHNNAIFADVDADSTVIVGNTVTNDAATPGTIGISGGGRVVIVDSNTVTGTGTPSNPNNASTYGWRVGIRLNGNQRGTVRANHITNVGEGMSFDNATLAAGSDNVIDNVAYAFFGELPGTNAPTMQRNDITNALNAIGLAGGNAAAFGAANFQCNWWETAAGPTNTSGLGAAVTPWAMQPIAGRAEVACP